MVAIEANKNVENLLNSDVPSLLRFFFSLALLVQSKNKNVCVCVFLLNDKKHMNICCCFYCYTVARLLCATLR